MKKFPKNITCEIKIKTSQTPWAIFYDCIMFMTCSHGYSKNTITLAEKILKVLCDTAYSQEESCRQAYDVIMENWRMEDRNEVDEVVEALPPELWTVLTKYFGKEK